MPTEEEVALLQSLADITSVSIENIEVRDQLEEQLSERTQMLEQLKKQKKQMEEFTHIIAHNMRAPLSNLIMLDEMVSETENIDEKLMYLDKQKPVIDFLHETFNEVVDAIHVKTDYNIARDHIELDKSFKKAMDLLQGEIIKSEAMITHDFSKAKTAYFPQKYMDSILFNLLSNAIKYRSPNKKPQVNIKSYKKDGWMYIEVQDNGQGIDLKKHGDKLFKLRKTFHEHPDAKGFGLFITKTQIEAMGGGISLDSTPGEGSTFTVKLNKNK
jgi:signal transduction histidine kinase